MTHDCSYYSLLLAFVHKRRIEERDIFQIWRLVGSWIPQIVLCDAMTNEADLLFAHLLYNIATTMLTKNPKLMMLLSFKFKFEESC